MGEGASMAGAITGELSTFTTDLTTVGHFRYCGGCCWSVGVGWLASRLQTHNRGVGK